MNIVLITALFAAVLAFVLGVALGFFRNMFAVEQDPLIGQVRAILPGANCGSCGFPGCDGYASAVAAKSAGINSCSVGGKDVAEKLSALIGVEANVIPMITVLTCRGSTDMALLKGEYVGQKSCRAAKVSSNGRKICAWGCIGFGDCIKVCQFDAIHMGADGLPHIDYRKCTHCKRCISECPQYLLRGVMSEGKGAMAFCSNHNLVKGMVTKACKAGCIKCEICVKNCPEQCIVMQNGMPAVDYTKCTSCGTCVSRCPRKVLKLIEHITAPAVQESV
jgi:RnfABCDGE-type electron transport complex B subunit